MKTSALLIGSHVSFTKPDFLEGSAARAIASGANAMMIYLGAPQNTVRAPINAYRINEYQAKYQGLLAPAHIVVHAPYIINPASPSKQKFAEEFLITEMTRMHSFRGELMVVHSGVATEQTREAALHTALATFKAVLRSIPSGTLLIETMAGKGNELGVTLEEIAVLVHGLDSPRAGVCLDTCHLWDAGYDLKNEAAYETLIEQLTSLKLLDKVRVIHLNDSKNERGARKDRHENIGKGQIGLAALHRIAHDVRFSNAIKILETPLVSETIYAEEIALLKSDKPIR